MRPTCPHVGLTEPNGGGEFISFDRNLLLGIGDSSQALNGATSDHLQTRQSLLDLAGVGGLQLSVVSLEGIAPGGQTVHQAIGNWLRLNQGFGQHQIRIVSHLPQSPDFGGGDRRIDLTDKDEISMSSSHPHFDGSAESLALSATDHANLRVCPAEFEGELRGQVVATIVDHEDLEVGSKVGQHLEELFDSLDDLKLGVSNGQNNADGIGQGRPLCAGKPRMRNSESANENAMTMCDGSEASTALACFAASALPTIDRLRRKTGRLQTKGDLPRLFVSLAS